MSTEIKTVTGIVADRVKEGQASITVRFTSDTFGESLSLEYDNQVMLQVRYEDIVPIINKARNRG